MNSIYQTQNIQPVKPAQQAPAPTQTQQKTDFASVLQQVMDEEKTLTFSGHAQQRIHSRNIELTPNDLSALNNACEKAESKGAKESLLLLRDLGFVVNIKNRNVITAIDKSEMKDKVFTNIDSTIIVG
jgi:flagellar operon protein